MTPLEIIRQKKIKSSAGDSCLPAADRLPGDVNVPDVRTRAITPPHTPPLTPSLAISPAAPCPTCGCPAFWHDRAPVKPHEAIDITARLAGHLHCGHCRPPPAAVFVHRWLMAVWVPLGPFGGGNVWAWEEFRPRFDLTRRRKLVPRSPKKSTTKVENCVDSF